MMPLCMFVLSNIFQVVDVSNIIQESGVKRTRVGGNVILRCSIQGDEVTYLYWFQQILMDKPQQISMRMTYSTKATISPGYQERFSVLARNQQGINDLIISALHVSDSAMYYCGMFRFTAIEFGQGVFLHVKPYQSNLSIHQQPALMSLQLGHPGNLSCTVHSEPCAGGQTFYWLKQSRSQPAVVYLGKRWCRNEGNICTSDFLVNPESSSDPGIYYCAVDTCGEIVFGNGTTVEIKRSANVNHLLVIPLSIALVVSLVVLLVLASIMYKLKNKTCTGCKGTISERTCPAASNDPSQDSHSLHYAALQVGTNTECHYPEETVCVYSRVRIRNE